MDKREPQTIVKHDILAEYLDTWIGIVTLGLRGAYHRFIRSNVPEKFRVQFTYVDCFGFEGRYQDDKDPRGWAEGSPLIGIKALDKALGFAKQKAGFIPEVYAILFERDPETYTALLKSLHEAGYGKRIRQVLEPSLLRSGDIAAINGNYQDCIDEVLQFTDQRSMWSFYLLDPYGPTGLELEYVSPIISQQRHDVMINFPYQDLHKKVGSEIRDTQVHIAHREHYDAMYGSQVWREVAKTKAGDELERALVQLYADTLQARDEELAVKTIPLRFKDRDRTMFYLFLTTHDSTGGLAMNRVLYRSLQSEHNLRIQWKTEHEEEQIRKSGGLPQLPLFDLEEEKAKGAVPPRPSIEEVADTIYERCHSETLRYREVLRRIVNTRYFPEEAAKAISGLRRRGLAEYKAKTLNNQTEITFK